MSTIKILLNRTTAEERRNNDIINQAKFLTKDAISFYGDKLLFEKFNKINKLEFNLKDDYVSKLNDNSNNLSEDDRLLISGYSIPYLTASVTEAKNVLILATPDDSEIIVFYDVKINVSQRNTIIETPLTGREGSVKEFIQSNDFKVTIAGNFISQNKNQYPITELREFVKFIKQPYSFKVANVYLESFNITNLVLESADYNQQNQQFFNSLPFSFSFLSDTEFEFEIE